MKLFFRKLGSGPPMIILHGLYGMSDNWISIAKVFSTCYEVYLPDLRNHGHSPHSPYHSYDIMQNDIYEFCNEHKIENAVIIGHSMGGKVAMNFAKLHPNMVSHLIVVDISPRDYANDENINNHLEFHREIINSLIGVNLSIISNRDEAEKALTEKIPTVYLRKFLLKNLKINSDKSFEWRFNLKILSKELKGLMEGVDIDEPITGFPILFIAGGLSDYIVKKDQELIEKFFPAAEIITFKNATHWLHAEYPIQFIKLINDFTGG